MYLASNLRDIIRVSITPLGLWSHAAEELLMMTAAHESLLGKFTKQIGGPALGIYQMEPATLTDIHCNYIAFRPELKKQIEHVSGVSVAHFNHLQYDPVYSSIMARIQYLRSPAALPDASDIWALAEYAKNVYNTRAGKADPADYHDAYRELVVS